MSSALKASISLHEDSPAAAALSERLGAWSDANRQQIESALEQRFNLCTQVPAALLEPMRYATLGGGKRLRALLVLATAQACGGSHMQAMSAACAVEALHAYSLVHDDLPCMDDDALRRGKPTCHIQFGEALALLAGDALQTIAFEWLAESTLSESIRLRQLQALAKAAGAAGMAGGQAIDLIHVGQPMDVNALLTMHRMKTGALIAASVTLGALCAQADERVDVNALEQYAQSIGLAFQVIDDIIDVEADSATLGKTAGKDALHNKPTTVSLLGLTEAKRTAASLAHEASSALQSFDDRAWVLRALVQQVIERRS